MTKTFNKVLAVALSLTCMVFLGFVIAYFTGGTNWAAEMRSPDLDEYSFQLSDGDNPTWTVTRDGQTVASSVAENELSGAIIKARKDLQTRQTAELGQITPQIPQLTQLIEAEKQRQQSELTAIDARIAELDQSVDAIHQDLLKVVGDVSSQVLKTTAARTQAANRRKDVYRLQNELEVLRNDRARLVELRRELAVELLQLQVRFQSLKHRVDQMQSN